MNTPAKPRYARIKLRIGGGNPDRTLLLEIVRDERLLVGFVVDREGERVGRSHERIVAIQRDVLSRVDLAISLKYGHLVPADQERAGLR